MSFIIVSGLSGSGKSTALNTLEDAGYFMTDNLPPELWCAMSDLCNARSLHRVAISTDSRTRDFLASLESSYIRLSRQREDVSVLFLEANAEVLIKRYNLTRREHPLGERLMLDFARERELLSPLRSIADTTLDTTNMTAQELSERVLNLFHLQKDFRLRLMSFGFKHSPPRDIDMLMDVRSLTNPYYDLNLRDKTGLSKDVAEHVFSKEADQRYYQELLEFIRSAALRAKKSGRHGYTVGIGCTGGQHRSVAVVERLVKDLQEFDAQISDHRDLPIASNFDSSIDVSKNDNNKSLP